MFLLGSWRYDTWSDKSTSVSTNVPCQGIIDHLDPSLEKFNHDTSLACLMAADDVNSDKPAPNCPLPYEVARPGNLRRGHANDCNSNYK